MRTQKISHTLENGFINNTISDVDKLPKKLSRHWFHKPYICDWSKGGQNAKTSVSKRNSSMETHEV